MNEPQADYGEFRLVTPRNDDLKFVRGSVEKAKVNPVRPGHHYMRIVAKVPGEGTTDEVIKLYHVDLEADAVVITETFNGVETARRTVPLGNFG